MGTYQYLRYKRMEKAKALIKEGYTPHVIANQLGYQSASGIYITFRQVYKESLAN